MPKGIKCQGNQYCPYLATLVEQAVLSNQKLLIGPQTSSGFLVRLAVYDEFVFDPSSLRYFVKYKLKNSATILANKQKGIKRSCRNFLIFIYITQCDRGIYFNGYYHGIVVTTIFCAKMLSMFENKTLA
jgi:hypothetical protein